MNEFKFEAIGIREENGIVFRLVIVLRGWIRYVSVLLNEQVIEVVDLGSAIRIEGEMMESR